MKKSPWVSVYNSGGCNGCILETFALVTPRYDIERFGCVWKSSARHADVLLVTGAVSKQTIPRIKRIYSQMADDKKVIGVGICTKTSGPFKGSYNCPKKLEEVIPVDRWVDGCPPRPEAIMKALLEVLEEIK